MSDPAWEARFEAVESALLKLSEDELFTLMRAVGGSADTNFNKQGLIRMLWARLRDLHDYEARYKVARDGLRQLL